MQDELFARCIRSRCQLTDPTPTPLLGEFTIHAWDGGQARGREASDAPTSLLGYTTDVEVAAYSVCAWSRSGDAVRWAQSCRTPRILEGA